MKIIKARFLPEDQVYWCHRCEGTYLLYRKDDTDCTDPYGCVFNVPNRRGYYSVVGYPRAGVACITLTPNPVTRPAKGREIAEKWVLQSMLEGKL